MAKKKNEEKCSLFEEMLMWTSYRYCIGRHTYVTTMAAEMAQHYYNKLSDERKEFTAKDIRSEIFDRLHWLPFNFHIHRLTDKDKFNPIEALMGFFEKEGIDSRDKLAKYSKVEYDAHTGEYEFNKATPTIKSYFSLSDIEDLLPWEDLASCFDIKNHKIVVVEYMGKREEYRCFKTWREKVVPCEDKPGYCRRADFGWEPVWVEVDKYVREGNACHSHINEDYIKEVKDIEE